MKTTTLSLLAALIISTPALAENTYPRFDRMDVNKDGVVELTEANTVCKVAPGIFNYADVNHDGKLSVKEVRNNFSLFNRC